MTLDTVLISGIDGKLGQKITQALREYYTVVGHVRGESLADKIHTSDCDLIIDVSSCITIHQHLDIYNQIQKPTIIGTSGLTPEEAYQYARLANFPLLIVPNFSNGFRIFMQQAIFMQRHYPIKSITETHHMSKKDSPSGSSLFLAHSLKHSNITSKRVPHYIAQHEVCFHDQYDTLSISHRNDSPKAFIEGVVQAITYIKKLKKGKVLTCPL